MAAIICNKVLELSKNPFCLYATAAVATNVGPIVVGLQATSSFAKCKGSVYCVGTMVFSIAHMAAAGYVAMSISNRKNKRLAGKTTSLGRATHMLCHDKWIAIYILILLAFFCWLCVGISWKLEGSIKNGGGCPNEIGSWVNTCIGCGFSFFSVCFYALIASLCVAWCCDKEDYSAPEEDKEAAYVQRQEDSTKFKPGLGGGGYEAPTPLAPVTVPTGNYGSTMVQTPPLNPRYDPSLPTAVAVPVHDDP